MEVGRVKKASLGQVRSKEAVAKESVQFQSIMDEEQSETTYDRLAKKVEEIEAQGEKLANSQTIDNLRKYKKMVKEFLSDVVSNGLELSQRFGFNQRGSSSMYRLVKDVDKKLIELTDEVIAKEKKGLDIVNLVGEIKGMLINIYT